MQGIESAPSRERAPNAPLPLLVTSPPRVRITDWALEQLRAAIISGDLGPGARLSVPALARQLGVSRSPVTAAVHQLVNDGLAVEDPHRGASVRVLDRDEIVAMYDVREVLEGLAARRAAEAVDDVLREDLRAILDRHARHVAGHDRVGHTEQDMAFHRRLREASGNHVLVAALDNLQLRVQLAMYTTTTTAGPDRALADHREIARAVMKGDPDAAEASARSHIRRLRRKLAQ